MRQAKLGTKQSPEHRAALSAGNKEAIGRMQLWEIELATNVASRQGE